VDLNTKILRRTDASRAKTIGRIADEARFIRSWIESPLKTGAVSPSGRFLARAMAQAIDPARPGLVVELGPGTGPVTEALVAQGVAPERLVLVEYENSFVKLLGERFPQTPIVQGDAYRLTQTLREYVGQPIAAVVSSLPLLTRPDRARLALLDEAFELMGPDGLFVQFTYGLASPMPLAQHRDYKTRYRVQTSQPVWLNLPPARVFRYTRADAGVQAKHQPKQHSKQPSPSAKRASGARPAHMPAAMRAPATHD
jgi:phosphatidylethanolamine/phosphatidyl-N-methylethanolamine N-methyltransferase